MGKFNAILVKTVRLTGWPLLALMVLYMLTGAVLADVGWLSWMSDETASWLHLKFAVPLAALTAAHSLPAVWLAMVRWGWIGAKRKS